jgi:hypothetical protein
LAEITLVAFKSYLWMGQMSLADQCKFGQYALEVYTQIGREAEVFHEGSESEAFWKALGGKTEYLKTSSKPPQNTKSVSKLYKYEKNSVEEITNFQKDVRVNFEVTFTII